MSAFIHALITASEIVSALVICGALLLFFADHGPED